MSRKSKITLIVTAWIVTSLLAGLVFTFCLLNPSNRIIAHWAQPTTVKYDSFDPYTLTVVEQNVDWFTLPWQHTYAICVGHETYGHYVRFSFYPGLKDLEPSIRDSKVEWSAEGVALLDTSGDRIFVPKKMFVGGR